MQRDARIDALRGCAIMLVLILHFSLSYDLQHSPLADWLAPGLLAALLWNGNYGVTLFFAISGFLITRQLLPPGTSPATVAIGDFYRRRAARIMPPLLLALGLIVALGHTGHPSFASNVDGRDLPASHGWWAALSVLTFWHNLLMQELGYFNYAMNVYWSLSVEELFYLAMPLLCVLLRRRRHLLLACLALIAIGPGYRALHRSDELYYMYGYWACFDALAMGVAAAILAPKLRLSGTARWLLQAAAVALLLFSFWMGIGGHEVFGFSQVALAGAGLLLLQPQAGAASGLLASRAGLALRWLGRHSYELYLFHCIVLGILRETLPRAQVAPATKLWLFLAFVALSAALAWLVERYWSEPWRQRLLVRAGRPAFIRA